MPVHAREISAPETSSGNCAQLSPMPGQTGQPSHQHPSGLLGRSDSVRFRPFSCPPRPRGRLCPPRRLAQGLCLLLALFSWLTPGRAQRVVTTIAAGDSPGPIAVNPVTNRIYAVSYADGTVTVIDGASNASVATLSVGSPGAIAVNPVTNMIYVADTAGNGLTVIDGATNVATPNPILVGTTPIAVAVNPVTNMIYVANQTSNNVSVIDGSTETNIGTLAVGGSPQVIGVNPVTNKIYVVNNGSSNVTVINGATLPQSVIATVNVGANPLAIGVNPVTNLIYVANANSSSVTVINGALNTTASNLTVTVGPQPRVLTVNPVSNKIYVANYNSASVSVIDGTTNTTGSTLTVAVGSAPVSVAANPTTNQIYVANHTDVSGGGSVSVIDGSVNTTASTSTVPLAVGAYPSALVVNPVTNQVYTVDQVSNDVTVIDGATDLTGVVSVGAISVSRGTAVAVNPATNNIYVAGSFAGNVTVIDGATNATTTVAVGYIPKAIAVNPVTNKIYAVNAGDSTVSVIDGATSTVTDTVTVGSISDSYGTAVAVNPVTNKIYVAGSFAGTVTVIDGATDATTTVNVGSIPKGIAVNPVTNKIYVVDEGSMGTSTVSVIDGATNTVTDTVTVATISVSYGSAVAVNPGTNRIYVTGSFAGAVTVIDGATDATTTVNVGSIPKAIAVNPVTNKIYVVNANDSTVSVINGCCNSVGAIVPVATISESYGTDVTVNLATDKIYVTGSFSNNVTEIDGATNTTATLAVGLTPTAIATNLATSYIYPVNAQASTVSPIAEDQFQPIPLTTTIAPLPGNVSTTSTPTFTFTASSAFAPIAPPVQNVYFQLDTLEGPWIAATPGAGNYTATSAPLQQGTHVVYAYATDGQDADFAENSQHLIGHIAAEVFTVILPGSNTLLTADHNPAAVGQSVTFTADVSSGGAGTLTGTVTFFDGATSFGSDAVASGTATLATSALSLGSHSITAVYSGDGNFSPSTSTVLTEVIAVSNPVPVETSLSVNSAIAGGAGFTLTVNGSNFVAGSVVEWNGAALATTFVGAAQVTAVVPGGDLAVAGTVAVTVFNSAPGGGASSALTFTINNPIAVQTSISPTFATLGGAGFTLTVNGSNFLSGSVVRWNGVALATTFLSGTQLTAAVPAGDLASAAAASITVFNSTPGGGASNALTLTINNPVPAQTSLSPNSVSVGGASFTLTANGANFVSGSVVRWNGVALATTFLSGTQLTAAVPAGDLASATTASITVFNSTPGGGASNTLTETVALTATSTTLTASPNPVVVGQPVTFTVTVSPAPTGSTLGTVSFFSGSTLLGTGTVNSSGVATFVTSGLSVGPGSITAVYSGNALFATSTSVALTETVAPLTVTSTTLAASPNPVVVGQPVTFTVTVSPAPTGSTLGTVSFFSGSTLLGMGTVNSSGVATFATSGLSVGAGNITAVYSGNALFATSTSVALTETVAPKTVTSTTLGASPNPVVVGQPVTFTVTVSPAPTGSTLGTVSFFSGATLLGMGTVNSSGVATYATSGLPVGTDAVTGIYSGNASFAASTSETANVTVTASQIAAVTVNFNPTSPVYGQVTTITVAETAGGLAVAGATATVTIGGHSYTCATNSSGQCVVTLPGGVLGGGSDSVTVATSATPNAAAGLFTFAVTVGLAPTTLALSSSSTEINAGNPVTLTATVASALPGMPTGMVTFYSNGTSIGTGILAGGVASLPLSTLATGAESISATYAGDANFLGSTAAGFTQTVLVNFTITAGSGSTPPTQTTPPGGTAVFPLSLGIINGFVGPVTMSATGLPPGATATFNPPIFNLDGVHPGTTVMSVVTAPANAQALPAQGPGPGSRSPISYGLLLLPLLAVGGILRRLRAAPLLLAALGVLSLGVATAALSGCGNGGYFGAAPASYVITVTGTSGALHHSTTVTLTIQ